MFPNQEELEKKFPKVPDDVFVDRVDKLTKELEKQGYHQTKIDDEFIQFRKNEGKTHIGRRFGLWQLQHEPNEDFERTLNRVKGE